MLLREIAATGPVDLLGTGELPDETLVCAIGVVGATSVFEEELPSGREFGRALAAVERWSGRRPGALASIEAAGLNAVSALVAAAPLGLPVVDTDLCGRALPRLDQFSIAVAGIGLTPAVLALPSGQVVLVEGGDAVAVERTVRSVLAATSGWAALAVAPLPLGVLRPASAADTIRRCLDLGRRMLALPDAPSPGLLAEATGGRVLAAGRVVDVLRHEGYGFGRGSVTVRDRRTSSLLRVEMENEFLLAFEDGAPVASTPDVLAVLDRRTAVPVTCDRIRRGDDVVVLQLAAPEFWCRPENLPAVAPRAFGFEVEPALLVGTP